MKKNTSLNGLRKEIYTKINNIDSDISTENAVFYTVPDEMDIEISYLCHFHNLYLATELLKSINLSKFKIAEYARAIELVDMVELSLAEIKLVNSDNPPNVIQETINNIKATDFSKILPRSLKRAANRISAYSKFITNKENEDTDKTIKKNRPTIFERILKSFIKFIDKYSKKGPKTKDIYTEKLSIKHSYEKFREQKPDTSSESSEETNASSLHSSSSHIGSPTQPKTNHDELANAEESKNDDKTLAIIATKSPQSQDNDGDLLDYIKLLYNHPGIFSQIFKKLPPKSVGMFAQASKETKKIVDTYYEKFLLNAEFNLPTDTLEKNRTLDGLLNKAINSKNPQLLSYVTKHMSEDKKIRQLKKLLSEAIKQNKIDIVDFLLNKDPITQQPYIDINSTITEQDRNSNYPPHTPLKLAASLGFDNIMRLCIDKGALIQSSGRTELFWAIHGKNVECVKIILSMIDNVKLKDPSKLNKDEVLNKSAYGAFVPQRTLTQAIECGNPDILEVLLEHGCKPTDSKHESDPILLAAIYGHSNLIPVLKKHGIIFNIKSPENFNSLIHTFEPIKTFEIIKEHISTDELTILTNILLINSLLKTDMETDSHIAEQNKAKLDDNICLPLHVLALYGTNVEENFLKTIIDNFITMALDINKQDVDQNTALHLAVLSRNIKLVAALLEAGADKNILNQSGKTPAQLSENPQITELFQSGLEPK